MPIGRLDDVESGNKKGECSESKVANAAHNNPSKIDGFDARWRGNNENPYLYKGKNADKVLVDEKQMDQCHTCAKQKNAKEYMNYANNKPEE
jgi:hypothetical protein